MVSVAPEVVAGAMYSLTDAARLLKISRTTLYKHIAERLIRPKTDRLNGRPFVTGAQILGFWKWKYRQG